MNTYDNGDLVKCTGTFTQSDAAIDPTSVYFKFKTPRPGSTITTYTYGVDVELVRADTGVYYVYVDANQDGEWRYRLYSTGTGQAAAEKAFMVRESAFD